MKKKIENEEGILASVKTHKILSKFKFIPITLFVIESLLAIILVAAFSISELSKSGIAVVIVAALILFFILEILIIISLLPLLIIWFIIKIRKSEIKVFENKITGKKGFRKFDIAYDKITHIEKSGKKLIIESVDRKVSLCALNNCDEIYNIIKQHVNEDVFAPRVIVKNAVSKTVDKTEIKGNIIDILD